MFETKPCPTCQGTGIKPKASLVKEVCPDCHGVGELIAVDFGYPSSDTAWICPTCQGTGKARPDRGLAITGLLYELNDFEERREPWKFIRPEIKAFYVARYQKTVTQILALLDEGK